MAKTPIHLSRDMKKFYRSVLADFNLESHHLILLTKACENLDRAEQARLEVEKDGLTTVDRYGSKKPHPCVKIEIDCKNSARLLLRELGLDLEPAGDINRPPGRY
ncbi:P27 family phage terminase small subunit [Herbivorax sp. ANBcel31]|uniref:P27 family phage terminase small subunit n=1 Tax=Herbivorax sp. ANBcel31 TaxID=3069754 RepID=UPI0027B4E6B6|nr:P27 family phage terminase small subunit [Herbivorax sp. ANBcel31]MDQ2086489.1 P27 family phage terminase small subunit [Herbivorax sp. ANBcel31]